jgi:hypothetical protein
MSADLEQIALIRSQTLALIAQITAAPKPSYNIDGQQVAWGDYLRQLQQTVDWCNRKLAEGLPCELRSQAFT